MTSQAACPVTGGAHQRTAATGMANKNRPPDQVNPGILNRHSPLIGPMGQDFDDAAVFQALDRDAVLTDLRPCQRSR